MDIALTVIYIVAISCQLTGALIVLKALGTFSREKMVETARSEQEENQISWGGFDADATTSTINKEKLQSVASNAYENNFAFILILLGYIFGIFGEIRCSKWIVLIFVLAITIALYFLDKKFISKIGNHRFDSDVNINDATGKEIK